MNECESSQTDSMSSGMTCVLCMSWSGDCLRDCRLSAGGSTEVQLAGMAAMEKCLGFLSKVLERERGMYAIEKGLRLESEEPARI